MRILPFLLCGLVSCSSLALAQTAAHPNPPGLREAEKHQPVIEPPRPAQRQRIDPAQLKQEADELMKLADTVPAQIEEVALGQIPKDLNDRLRRIEKLAKRLRSHIAP